MFVAASGIRLFSSRTPRGDCWILSQLSLVRLRAKGLKINRKHDTLYQQRIVSRTTPGKQQMFVFLQVVGTGAGAGLVLEFLTYVSSTGKVPTSPITVCYASDNPPLLRFVTNELLVRKPSGVRVAAELLSNAGGDDKKVRQITTAGVSNVSTMGSISESRRIFERSENNGGVAGAWLLRAVDRHCIANVALHAPLKVLCEGWSTTVTLNVWRG